MKPRTYNSLDLDLQVPAPETVEEFDTNAGKPGACLNEAINNVVYRSWLADFRSLFLHGGEIEVTNADGTKSKVKVEGIDDITKIEREGTANDAGEIVKWTETEGKYFARVCAKLQKPASEFQAHANKIAKLIPFDAKASPRTFAPKKTAKAYLDAATQIIDKGEAVASKVAAELAKLLGIDVQPNRESLGKAISLHEAKKREAEKPKLASQYIGLVEV